MKQNGIISSSEDGKSCISNYAMNITDHRSLITFISTLFKWTRVRNLET